MRPIDREKAASLALFAKLDETSVESLLQGAFLQRFPAHVELIREGDPADFLHIVVDGLIEVFATDRDRETTIAIVGPNDCFILAPVVLDQPYLQAARTLNPSQVLMVPAVAVRQLFDRDPVFARQVAEELARAYRHIARELKNHKLRTSLERLANWILTADTTQGESGTIILPYEKRTLAARLGMTPENLSRNFATLTAYGTEVTGREIRIGDRDALVALAKPSELIDQAAG